MFGNSGVLTGLILAVLGLMTATLLIRVHRRLRRQKKDDAALLRTLRPKRTDRGHNLDAPDGVLRWEVQMHETARELSAQLDSKMGALQVLIADADRTAARLEAALAGQGEPSGPSDAPDSHRITQAEALRSAETPDSASAETADTHPRQSPQHRREEIYTLSDYGYDAAEIARRVGSPIGEVELVLGLRDRK